MTPSFDRASGEGGGSVDPGDHAELEALAGALEADRPVPAPALRSKLRSTIHAAGNVRARPPQLRRQIAIYELCGCVLLAVAALGLAGAGPLAP